MVDEMKQLITTSAMLFSAMVNMNGSPANVPSNRIDRMIAVKAASSSKISDSSRSVRKLSANRITLIGTAQPVVIGTQTEESSEPVKKNLSASASKAQNQAAKLSSVSSSQAKAYSLSASERDLVERVIMTSCGTLKNLKMAEANAQVILDRVKSGKFGSTLKDVLTAPMQFETPWNGEVNGVVKQAVAAVFDDGVRVISKPVYYYMNPHDSAVLENTWKAGKVYVTTIGTGHFIHQYWTSD